MEWSGFTRTSALFFATAIAELVSCYLPLLWLTGKGSTWLLLPAAASPCDFCLAADTSPYGQWPGLWNVRSCLYRNSPRLALASGWGNADLD